MRGSRINSYFTGVPACFDTVTNLTYITYENWGYNMTVADNDIYKKITLTSGLVTNVSNGLLTCNVAVMNGYLYLNGRYVLFGSFSNTIAAFF